MDSNLSNSEYSLYFLIENTKNDIHLETTKNCVNLLEASIRLDEMLTKYAIQGATEPKVMPVNASKRISLTAGLLQAARVPEYLIFSGQYWAASSVIRQHLEAIARLNELRNDIKIKKKDSTPNVSVLPKGLSSSYGRLSELAHVSKGEYLQTLVGFYDSVEMASVIPVYRNEWAVELFKQHLRQLYLLLGELDLLHQELYPHLEYINLEPNLSRVLSVLEDETP